MLDTRRLPLEPSDQVLKSMIMARAARRLAASGVLKAWPKSRVPDRGPVMNLNPNGLVEWTFPKYELSNFWTGLVRTAVAATGLPPAFALVYVPPGLMPEAVHRLLGGRLAVPEDCPSTTAQWVQAFTPEERAFTEAGQDLKDWTSDPTDLQKLVNMLAAIGMQLDGQLLKPDDIPFDRVVRLAQFPSLELLWTGNRFSTTLNVRQRTATAVA